MVHSKPTLPAGHGEVLTRPAFSAWEGLARANHETAAEWTFEVNGKPATRIRSLARREALDAAGSFSEVLGIALTESRDPDGLVVATGHQPELYHPGVWIKDFLLQRLGEESVAAAFDVVVDTDGFETLSVSSPCMSPGVARCQQYLAVGGQGATYAGASVPSQRDLDDFCEATASMLASLPAPAVTRHFASFCEDLRSARGDAGNLAELVTIARRRYEASAGTDYLELPLTRLIGSESFAEFVCDIARNASAFSDAYNGELDDYRTANKTRNSAQPFPNLGRDGGRVELPLWSVSAGVRESVWVESDRDGNLTFSSATGRMLARIDRDDEPVVALAASGVAFAPKALLLTLFVRLFCCDLFIHGVGGGRYDSVTDGVCRRYFGVEPPAFVVASITMYLPLGAHAVTDEEIATAKDRINRLEHNPDALLGEVEFDSADERAAAIGLAQEKSRLVAAIAEPDADRKTIGIAIKAANAELSLLLEPLRQGMRDELATLESQRAAAEILTDRTYPFCLWSPEEVADKAR